MIHSAVLTQSTRVTDGRTDGRTDGQTDGIGVAYTRYMLSRVKMQKTRDFKVDFWKFFWGIAHRLRNGEGLRRPFPNLPLGAPSALPGNTADLWKHCSILWAGAATGGCTKKLKLWGGEKILLSRYFLLRRGRSPPRRPQDRRHWWDIAYAIGLRLQFIRSVNYHNATLTLTYTPREITKWLCFHFPVWNSVICVALIYVQYLCFLFNVCRAVQVFELRCLSPTHDDQQWPQSKTSP